MSELKVYRDPKEGPCWREFYEKSEADKVIAEKDKEIAELKSDIADLRDDKKSTDAILDECNAEIAELKATIAEKDASIVELKAKNKRLEELKDKYSSCAEKAIDSIAKCELKIRSLSRALYKACANWADVAAFCETEGIGYDNSVAERWRKMERKCLKKTEEYK